MLLLEGGGTIKIWSLVEDVKSLGTCPGRGHWDTGQLLSLLPSCHENSSLHHTLPHEGLLHYKSKSNGAYRLWTGPSKLGAKINFSFLKVVCFRYNNENLTSTARIFEALILNEGDTGSLEALPCSRRKRTSPLEKSIIVYWKPILQVNVQIWNVIHKIHRRQDNMSQDAMTESFTNERHEKQTHR